MSTSRAKPDLSYPKTMLRSAPGPNQARPGTNPRSELAAGTHPGEGGSHRRPALPARPWLPHHHRTTGPHSPPAQPRHQRPGQAEPTIASHHARKAEQPA